MFTQNSLRSKWGLLCLVAVSRH